MRGNWPIPLSHLQPEVQYAELFRQNNTNEFWRWQLMSLFSGSEWFNKQFVSGFSHFWKLNIKNHSLVDWALLMSTFPKLYCCYSNWVVSQPVSWQWSCCLISNMFASTNWKLITFYFTTTIEQINCPCSYTSYQVVWLKSQGAYAMAHPECEVQLH